MSDIKFEDRVLVLGDTGSGKSELLNLLFTRMGGGCRRVLLDTKPEFAVPDPARPGEQIEPAGHVDEIDWRAPVVHFKTSAPSVGEIEELFNVLKQRRRTNVCVHELSDLCEYNAGKTPPSVNAYVSKGRVFGLGLLGGSQRPVNIPSRVLTDAQHSFTFATGFANQRDMDAAAQAMGMRSQRLEQVLEEMGQAYGPHSFLQFDRREMDPEHRWTIHPALGDDERRGIVVDRPVLY